jgi:hypothetical protein
VDGRSARCGRRCERQRRCWPGGDVGEAGRADVRGGPPGASRGAAGRRPPLGRGSPRSARLGRSASSPTATRMPMSRSSSPVTRGFSGGGCAGAGGTRSLSSTFARSRNQTGWTRTSACSRVVIPDRTASTFSHGRASPCESRAASLRADLALLRSADVRVGSADVQAGFLLLSRRVPRLTASPQTRTETSLVEIRRAGACRFVSTCPTVLRCPAIIAAVTDSRHDRRTGPFNVRSLSV